MLSHRSLAKITNLLWSLRALLHVVTLGDQGSFGLKLLLNPLMLKSYPVKLLYGSFGTFDNHFGNKDLF